MRHQSAFHAAAALLALLGGIACAEDDGAGPDEPPAIDVERIDSNDVLTVIDNRGVLGHDLRTLEGVGYFPAGSANNYLWGSGLWVGGIRRGTKVVYSASRPHPLESESRPGRVEVNGGGGGHILCSDRRGDLARWYPEFRDGSAPLVYSGTGDCVVIYNDAEPIATLRDVFGNVIPAEALGVEVRQRTVAFPPGVLSEELATQVVFAIWDIVNVSPEPIEEAYVGVRADYQIGYFFDDRCSAIPSVPPGPNNPTGSTIRTDLAFCWDHDFAEGAFDPAPPGFAGVSLLRSPAAASSGGARLTSFTLMESGVCLDCPPIPLEPIDDEGQYDLLAGTGSWTPVIGERPADEPFVASSGPFRLDPRQTERIVAAYVWANASTEVDRLEVDRARCFPQGRPCFLPDPNDPALRKLIEVQQAAQRIADALF